MRIAIVGSGLTGLSAAHVLGEDPRHVITVFETRARFGAESVDHLARLGVALHRSAQVERLAVVATGVWLWVHGRPERFDAALVATSAADARALLVRSGMARRVGSATLAERVYFAEDGRAAAGARAHGRRPPQRALATGGPARAVRDALAGAAGPVLDRSTRRVPGPQRRGVAVGGSRGIHRQPALGPRRCRRTRT